MFMHDLMQTPEWKAVFTINTPIDLVAPAFLFLILSTFVGGTISMLHTQLSFIWRAVQQRKPSPILASDYTKAILNGTSPEITILKNTTDPTQRSYWIKEVCRKIEKQDSSTISRQIVKELKRLEKEKLHG